jgi:hypothetical protein
MNMEVCSPCEQIRLSNKTRKLKNKIVAICEMCGNTVKIVKVKEGKSGDEGIAIVCPKCRVFLETREG